MPRLTGSPPARAHQRHERVGVAARDLPAAQDLLGLVDVHDLVAAAEDGDPRPPVDQRVRHGERREHAELRRAERRARGEHRRAAPDVLARGADVDAGVAVADDRDRRPRPGRCPPAARPCRRRPGSGAPVKIRALSPGPSGARGERAGGNVLDHPEPHRPLRRRAARRRRRGRRSRPWRSWPRRECRAGSRRPRRARCRARRRAARGARAGGGRRRGSGAPPPRRPAARSRVERQRVLQREGGEQLEPHRVLEVDHPGSRPRSRDRR